MDATRLASVVSDIVVEIEEWDIVGKLQAARDALHRSTSAASPSADQEFRSKLEELLDSLDECTSSSFRPSELAIAQQIGADRLTGSRLAKRIREIVDALGATPSTTLAELGSIQKSIAKLFETLKTLLQQFDNLHINPEELSHGEGEIGVIIPQDVFGSRLESMRDELQQINRYLNVFPLLFDDEPSPLEVRNIASGSWEIFLFASTPVAAAMAIAVERIVALYKQTLEIRLLKAQLEEQKVNKKAGELVEQRAKEIAEEGLRSLHSELLARARTNNDKGRNNELSNGLMKSLGYLADRVDAGMSFEAAIGFPDDNGNEDLEGEEPEGPGPNVDPGEVRSLSSAIAELDRAPDKVFELPESLKRDDDQLTFTKGEIAESSEDPIHEAIDPDNSSGTTVTSPEDQ